MIEFAFALALMAQEPATEPQPATPPIPAAQPAAPSAPKTATQIPSAGDEIVCRRVETATGSRLGRGIRVCRPAREWEAAADSAQKATNEGRRAFRPDEVGQ
jgi:hypothetical protein